MKNYYEQPKTFPDMAKCPLTWRITSPPTENHCSSMILQSYIAGAVIFPLLQIGNVKLWQVVTHLMCGGVLCSLPSAGGSKPLGNRTLECTTSSALDHLGTGSFQMLSPDFLSNGGDKTVAF